MVFFCVNSDWITSYKAAGGGVNSWRRILLSGALGFPSTAGNSEL